MGRDPPKTFVSTAAVLPVAFMDARQGMETELSHGQMYAGKNSYVNMPPNAYQKVLSTGISLKQVAWRWGSGYIDGI